VKNCSVCVSSLSLIDAKRQFLSPQKPNEQVAPTHRKIHASAFIVALFLTGKRGGVDLWLDCLVSSPNCHRRNGW
jgi:hypothetical protein